jgi:hypothetical protein
MCFQYRCLRHKYVPIHFLRTDGLEYFVSNNYGIRPLRRLRRRCVNNIKMDLGEVG